MFGFSSIRFESLNLNKTQKKKKTNVEFKKLNRNSKTELRYIIVLQ